MIGPKPKLLYSTLLFWLSLWLVLSLRHRIGYYYSFFLHFPYFFSDSLIVQLSDNPNIHHISIQRSPDKYFSLCPGDGWNDNINIRNIYLQYFTIYIFSK